MGASHHSPLSFAWALCISSWRVTTVQWSPCCMCCSKPRGAHCRFWEQSSPWPAGNLTPNPWSQLQGDAVGWIPGQVQVWRQRCREVLVWLLLAWNFFQALIWTWHPKIPAIPSNYGSSGITDLKGLTCLCLNMQMWSWAYLCVCCSVNLFWVFEGKMAEISADYAQSGNPTSGCQPQEAV